MKQLFSAYGASRALERDRQTIERAVRGLAPDAYERGKPRWRLSRIVEALNAQPARNNRGRSQHDPALEVHFARLDALDASVRGAPTLEERRTLARELFPVLARVDRLMHGDARSSGEDPQITGYRCERHLQTMLWTLREPCGWNFEEMLGEFNRVAEAV
jgi:hypothetical protein